MACVGRVVSAPRTSMRSAFSKRSEDESRTEWPLVVQHRHWSGVPQHGTWDPDSLMPHQARVVLALRVETVDHDHDHMCLDCLLWCGIRLHRVITAGGLTTMHTIMWCPECGGTNVQAVPDARHC